MYKAILLIILIVGIICITIGIVRSQTLLETQGNGGLSGLSGSSETPEIIYKYIPRTFEEEQQQPVYVSEIFDTMFSQPSPWIISVRDYDERKQEKINQYFISQM